MSPDRMAALVDAAIPLAAGVYAMLLGFRAVGKPPGASREADRWHEKYGRLFRGLGPVLIVVALVQIVRHLMMAR